jgi:hypothetical protein
MKSFSVLALTAVLAVPCFANASVSSSSSPTLPYPRAGKSAVALSPTLPYPRAGKSAVALSPTLPYPRAGKSA